MIYGGLQELQRFLVARALGASADELRELQRAAQMAQAGPREFENKSVAMPDRGREPRGVSTIAEARARARELQLGRAHDAAMASTNEDEFRAAIALRDRAMDRDPE